MARPWDAELTLRLGMAYRAQGELPKAREILQRAYQMRTWHVGTIVTYAEVLQASGDASAALALIRDALRTQADPMLGAAFVVAAEAAGEYAAAADFLEELADASANPRLGRMAAELRARASQR